jgi:hypothetical protein
MSADSDHKPLGVRKSVWARGVAADCAGQSEKPPPDKPMTAAQRRGLARKITAYLKRSGLDCELVDDDRNPPALLN